MRSEADRLIYIAQAIGDIEAFVHGMGPVSFTVAPRADRRTFLAVVACLAAIGEAVKYLSDELTARHPEVDWRGFAGLRDILAHRYFGVRPDSLWAAITNDLPRLKRVVERELGRRRPGS